MIDSDSLRAIAGVVAILFPSVIKYIEKRGIRKRKEKQSQDSTNPDIQWRQIRERLIEFDEIIQIPNDGTIPEELAHIIEERNYYKLLCEHYRQQLEQKEGLEHSHGTIKDILRALPGSDPIDHLSNSGDHSSGLAPDSANSPERRSEPLVRSSPSIEDSDHVNSIRDHDIRQVTESKEVRTSWTRPNSGQEQPKYLDSSPKEDEDQSQTLGGYS